MVGKQNPLLKKQYLGFILTLGQLCKSCPRFVGYLVKLLGFFEGVMAPMFSIALEI